MLFYLDPYLVEEGNVYLDIFSFGQVEDISFSYPVKIVLSGQTGKSAFITEFDGMTKQVTIVCDSLTPTNVPAEFACVFDDGVHTFTASIFSSASFTEITKNGSGGCDGDCTPPTFGNDKHGKQIVQDGFSYNGNKADVTDYHTEFPLITVKTHFTNTVTLKVYENNGVDRIKWVQFGLGMLEVGSPLNHAQTLVTIYLDDAKVESIEKQEKYFLVDIIDVNTSVVDCGYVEEECLQVSMNYIYRDKPKYNVMAINAMDTSRNSQTNFMNDGVLVIGDSMNIPLETSTTSGNGGAFYHQRAGAVELTLVDYKTDLWQDSYGYLWKMTKYGPQIIDTVPQPIKEPDPMWAAMTRMNSNFADMIIYEQAKAYLIFDGSKLINALPESWSYELPDKEGAAKEFEEQKILEVEKAEKTLKELLYNTHRSFRW